MPAYRDLRFSANSFSEDSAGLSGSPLEKMFPPCQHDRATGSKNGERRDATDIASVAIDGRKWIASRFHPNLLTEKWFFAQ